MNVNMTVGIIMLFIVSAVLFAIFSMFYNSLVSINYDSQINPNLLYQGEIKDICFDEMVMYIDSCIYNDTIILQEEGIFRGEQLSKYRCKYVLFFKTGNDVIINCSRVGKTCFIDTSGKYDIGICR